MKIVMLCDLFVASLQYQENLLAKYYIRNGHQVVIIASTFDSVFDYVAGRYQQRAPSVEDLGESLRIFRQPYRWNLANKLRKLEHVQAVLEKEKPDLIFAHDIHLNLAEAVRYRQTTNRHCRIIMDYHADYSNSGRSWLSLNILHRVVRRAFLHRVLPSIDRIFPVVPSSAQFLHEVYGLPYERMELLQLGADTEWAEAVVRGNDRHDLRHQYGIGEDELVICTGGKLTPSKRTDVLIEAFLAILPARIHLFVVGAGEPNGSDCSEKLVKVANGEPRIHFTGWIESLAVYRYLAASDVAIFPASQSVLWQQALSVGVPLVAGQVAGQDVSYLNACGAVLPLNQDEITTARIGEIIRELLRDPERLRQMKRAASETAARYLDYNKIVAKTLDATNDSR